jgi:hypothetical protein
MSKPLPTQKAQQIIVDALRTDMPTAAAKHGISRQWVHKVFTLHLSTVMLYHEIYDDSGSRRKFSELQRLFNKPIPVKEMVRR